MLTGFEIRTPEDASDRKLLADVEKFGWHIVAVFDDSDDVKRPGFSLAQRWVSFLNPAYELRSMRRF